MNLTNNLWIFKKIEEKKGNKKILIIDFGSQYSQLISKRIRSCGIYSEIIEYNCNSLKDNLEKFDAFILSGSPNSVNDENSYSISKKIFESGKPILGICYGMQLIHQIFGGEIKTTDKGEFGETTIIKQTDHILLDGIPLNFNVWMSHNDSVTKLAKGFKALGKSNDCIAISANDQRKIYTVQFHPEIENSNYGKKIFENFLFLICKFTPYWETKALVEEKTKKIKEEVKNERVLLALSGGIDSSVTAELLHLSIPNNVIYVFINTGLLPKNYEKKVVSYFSEKFKDNFHYLNKEEEFFTALKNIKEPEEKRIIIGKLFATIFNEFSKKYSDIKYLAQGTIYTDLIESGKTSKESDLIKTHHNTIEELKNKFKLLEPLSDLFKDEVKKIGQELKIENWILEQHPFPGPGLAIRISGEITKEKINLLKDVDEIFIQILKKHDIHRKIKQAFTILPDIKSVGIKGDKRNYGYAIILRAINTTDFMTSDIVNFSWNLLKEISSEITGKIEKVNRVLYDITSKPPSTIEWE